MKNRFTQKEIWFLIKECFKRWKGYHHHIVEIVAIEEAFELIEDDNDIVIPLEWKIKFRKRLC